MKKAFFVIGMDITDLIFIKFNGTEAGRELTLKDLLHFFFFSRK
jgi:hypothetical protein